MEATISSPRDGVPNPRKKWWNAQNVVAGLQNRDESDLSNDEEELADCDSDNSEREVRQRQLKHIRKGKNDPKVMESPVYPSIVRRSDNSISLR